MSARFQGEYPPKKSFVILNCTNKKTTLCCAQGDGFRINFLPASPSPPFVIWESEKCVPLFNIATLVPCFRFPPLMHCFCDTDSDFSASADFPHRNASDGGYLYFAPPPLSPPNATAKYRKFRAHRHRKFQTPENWLP